MQKSYQLGDSPSSDEEESQSYDQKSNGDGIRKIQQDAEGILDKELSSLNMSKKRRSGQTEKQIVEEQEPSQENGMDTERVLMS